MRKSGPPPQNILILNSFLGGGGIFLEANSLGSVVVNLSKTYQKLKVGEPYQFSGTDRHRSCNFYIRIIFFFF